MRQGILPVNDYALKLDDTTFMCFDSSYEHEVLVFWFYLFSSTDT